MSADTTTAPHADVFRRNNVHILGNPAGRPIVFVHAFGCGQEMWRLVTPAFLADHQVVLYDHVGSGASDRGAYERTKYDSLHGYAADLLEIVEQLDLRDVVCVGHSVGAMISLLATTHDSTRFGALVLVGPSPRYLDGEGYQGGFAQSDIDSLLESIDANYLGWSTAMAPVIMANPDRPELTRELSDSFCGADPTVTRHFARVTFLSDHRRDLRRVTVPTLIIACADDVVAPAVVAEYVNDTIADSRLVHLSATGHWPILSAPTQLAAAVTSFLA